MASSANATRRADVYDERHLQSKALAHWEKQRQAWDNVKERLARESAQGNAAQGASGTFRFSSSRHRERQEELGMIEAAVPLSALSKHYTWESMLRRENDAAATRYVQLGKSYYPYALYAKLRDPTSNPVDHPAYARVVTEDHIADPLVRTRGATAGASGADGSLEAIEQSLWPAQSNTSAAAADTASRIAAASRLAATDAYFGSQLRAYAPYIESRFTHFSVPRDFLQVVGGPAPVAHDSTGAAREAAERADPAPVEFIATATAPPPLRVAVPPTVPPPRVGPAQAFAPSAAASDRAAGEGETTQAADPSVAVRLSASAPLSALASPTDGLNDSRLFDHSHADDGEEGSATAPTAACPSLELSTQRIFFMNVVPGELAHAQLTVRNTGPVTVYYSWDVVDLVAEGQRTDLTAGSVDSGGAGAMQEPIDTEDDTESIRVRGGAQTLHALAEHRVTSATYFKLSAPVNGALLPDTREAFPFSVRLPRAGCYKQTYELLTVPTSPVRVLVELTAVARELRPSAIALARPVEEAMRTNAVEMMQRQLLQRIVRSDDAFDSADLRRDIELPSKAKETARDAEAERRAAQQAAWDRHNALTFDHLPFNEAVYDKLEALWTHLGCTVARLQATTADVDEIEADTSDNSDTGASAAALPWDGSLNRLLRRLCQLRDAPSRAILYDAMMVLLRAARVAGGTPSSGDVQTDTAAHDPTLFTTATTTMAAVDDSEDITNSSDATRRGRASSTAVPLAVLLRRAATALAEQLDARRRAHYVQEVELLQLPQERTVFQVYTPGGASAGGGGGNPASSTSAGSQKKRSPSASGGGRRTTTTPASSAGAALTGPIAYMPMAGTVPPAVPSLPAVRMMASAPPAAVSAASGGPMTAASLYGSLRQQLRAPSASDDDAVAREAAEMQRMFSSALRVEQPSLVRALTSWMTEAVEEGCDLSLLDVVQAHRRAELAIIQQSECVPVDSTTADASALRSSAASGGGVGPTKRKS